MGEGAALVVGGDAGLVAERLATEGAEARDDGTEDDEDAATVTDGGTDVADGCAGVPAHASTIGANKAAASL